MRLASDCGAKGPKEQWYAPPKVVLPFLDARCRPVWINRLLK